MQSNRRLSVLSCAVAATAATVAFGVTGARATVAYDGTASYTQNFDTLPNSPTNTALAANQEWVDDTTLPGWYYVQALDTTNEGGWQRLRASSGNSSTGSLYSFGVNSTTERALGFVDSNTLGNQGGIGQYLAVRLRNTSANTYTSFTLSYNGEQWRDGGAAVPNAQSIQFGYKTDAVGLKDSTYTHVSGLDFTSPVFTNTGSGAAVVGNTAGRVAINSSGALVVTGLNWEPGQDLWLRWTDVNDAGNDHGLAIDDVSFTAGGATTGGTSRTWVSPSASGNWSDSSMWLNGNVGGGGTLARLGSAMTADETVTLDVSPTVSGLMMSPSTHNYTLAANAGQALNVAAGGAVSVSNGAFAQVSGTTDSEPAGAHVISAPVNFATDASFNVGDLATLSVTGQVTAGPGGGLQLAGSGTLVVAAANSYSGPTTLNGGTLSFSNGNQLGDNSPTNGIVVNAGNLNPTADITMTRSVTFNGDGGINTNFNVNLGAALNAPATSLFTKTGSGTLNATSLNTGAVYLVGSPSTASAGVLQILPAATTPAAASKIAFVRLQTDSGGFYLGKLDLTNNALVVDYTGTTPLTNSTSFTSAGGTTLGSGSKIATALWYAFDNGHWDRTGVTSSLAQTASTDPVSAHSVGYAEASRLLGLTGTQTATWHGQTVDATSVLLMYTWGGDANLDGKVDGDDYALVDRQYLKDQASGNTTAHGGAADQGLFDQWQDGDFNYDGIVSSADYLIIDRSFLAIHPGSPDAAGLLAQRQAQFGDAYVAELVASVPEPGTLSLVGLGMVPLLSRRRRMAR